MSTQAIAFVNPPVFEMPPQLDESDQAGRCCLAPHYYDGLTLLYVPRLAGTLDPATES